MSDTEVLFFNTETQGAWSYTEALCEPLLLSVSVLKKIQNSLPHNSHFFQKRANCPKL